MSVTNHDGDHLWGAGDIAKFLRVSQRTVWRWKSIRRLPKPRYAGKIVRWWRSDILRWFDDGCPPQAGDQQ